MNTFTRLESFSNPNSNPKLKPTKDTKTAGLAIIAEDTGRVLMLQRQNSPKKSGGKWEFPGGHVENGEAHHEAAIREWEEETGIKFPEHGTWNDLHWLSPDNKYMGLIYRIPHESDIEINPPKSRRVQNPDDLGHENMETVAWWDPKDLIENPALREEAHSTPWHILAGAEGNPYHDSEGRFTTSEDDKAGMITLYHRTTPEAADAIKKSGHMISKENTQEIYASTHEHGNAEGYGQGVVKIRVPVKDTEMDDEFPNGEQHYRIPANKIGPKNILASAANSFSLLEFYNENHDEKGRFAPSESSGGTAKAESETKTKPEDIRNFGFGDWPKSRATAVLTTVANLKDKYPGVEDNAILSVNASNRIGNIASELGALAAVDSHAPTHIDIAPEMKSQAWLKENSVDYTVSKASLEDTITHEFGHIVELALPPNLRTELAAPFLKAIESSFDLEDGKGDGKEFLNLTHTVSEYAGDNVSEGIAEAFLQHEKGIHNEYSDHVGAVLAKWKEARGTK